MESYLFPEGFLWGSSTSAWQVEGGIVENEYRMLHRRGLIADGGDPAQAAGFWTRYEDDIRLMRRMHHRSFRMSVEWARVEPEEGWFDEEAIRHYRSIVGAVAKAGILPVVDLHHHSNPLWVCRDGGWMNPRIVPRLRRFAARMAEELGDLVGIWLTINEPTIWAAEAYFTGELPPHARSPVKYFTCLDLLAKAHVVLYETLNEVHARKGWPRPSVGFAHAAHGIDPFDPGKPLDRIASNWFQSAFEERFLASILGKGRTIDLLGINYYFCLRIRFPLSACFRTDFPSTKEGWPIDPLGFHRVLTGAWERWRVPLWVMENGVAEDDDELRPRFILDHVYQMHRAIRDGADVRAYHHWATMDTLEYRKGYGIRYGLIGVDMESPEKTRTLRRSGTMYGEIAAANGITDEIVRRHLPGWTPDSFPKGYEMGYARSGGRPRGGAAARPRGGAAARPRGGAPSRGSSGQNE
jgi:beta-glucosidase